MADDDDVVAATSFLYFYRAAWNADAV